MNICIYGASSNELDPKYYEDAEKFGEILGSAGHTLVFGGGNGGLMGACARGVHKAGGSIIGIAPKFFDEPGILCGYCTEFIYTETMRERKHLMEDKADAFVILPGGIGTFEEFFETLTLKQLGRHSKPMVILNTLSYYDSMMTMLKTAADNGFMSKSCLDIFGIVKSPKEIMSLIESSVKICGSIKRLSDYNK